MIEIVAGDRVPDLPFVIVDRQAATSISPDRGALGRTMALRLSITPDRSRRQHVGEEEADGLRLPILIGACGPFASGSAPRLWGTRKLGNAMPAPAVLFTEERE